MSQTERRLAAIMFTDIVGFATLADKDENLALDLLKKHREMIRPILGKYGGTEIKTIGDGTLVEFPSTLGATQCAVAIEQAVTLQHTRDSKTPLVKIGIHVGDVIHEKGDVYGDAVNIASRIEPLAQGGGTCVSQQVYDQIRNKVPCRFTKLGTIELKNISAPMDVYRLEIQQIPTATTIQQASERRLAVLPFANMSPDPTDDYFADGLTEEVIATMSKISGLKVIARTSVMGYKANRKRISEIAADLRVGSILEGSVRKAGNRIRITVQLINSVTSDHLWTESYDRELNDVFAIQSDIAKAVAESLRIELLSKESAALKKEPATNPDAYTLYLKGRFAWNKRTRESLNEALDCFEQCVKIDPEFALGYTGLSDTYTILGSYNFIAPNLASDRAKDFSKKALQLDPDSAEAHATKGLVLSDEFDLKGAEIEFQKAIETKPSFASAHQWYHMILLAQLRWDEALEQIETAAELDPFSPAINDNLAHFYYAKRDFSRALEVGKRNAALNPAHVGTHTLLATVYAKLGMYDDAAKEAVISIEALQGTYPYVRDSIDALIACMKDDRRAVERLLPELEAHWEEAFADALLVGDLYFYLNQKDKGFEWLERSYSRRETGIYFIRSDEFLDNVREDPRYLSMLNKVGLGYETHEIQTR